MNGVAVASYTWRYAVNRKQRMNDFNVSMNGWRLGARLKTMECEAIHRHLLRRLGVSICALVMAACSTAPAYKTEKWRDCYMEFGETFLEYAENARDCGYVRRENPIQTLRKAQSCVRRALRNQERFLIAKLLNGTDEWGCDVVIGGGGDPTYKLSFSSDLYVDHGRFEAFQCAEVQIEGHYLSGVDAINCEAIESPPLKQ